MTTVNAESSARRASRSACWMDLRVRERVREFVRSRRRGSGLSACIRADKPMCTRARMRAHLSAGRQRAEAPSTDLSSASRSVREVPNPSSRNQPCRALSCACAYKTQQQNFKSECPLEAKFGNARRDGPAVRACVGTRGGTEGLPDSRLPCVVTSGRGRMLWVSRFCELGDFISSRRSLAESALHATCCFRGRKQKKCGPTNCRSHVTGRAVLFPPGRLFFSSDSEAHLLFP